MRASSVVMLPLFPTARTLDDNNLYRLINRLAPTALLCVRSLIAWLFPPEYNW
jgi:hypothetical protein